VVVTSDRSTENITTQNLHAQDSSGGIVLRFTADHSIDINQEIQVAIMGTTVESYNGLLQINNIPLGNVISEVAATSVPTPVSITLAEALTGDYESQLVQISGVQFSAGDTYSGNNTLTDCTDNLAIYVRSSATFAGETLPTTNGTITGVMSVFNSPQLYIRDTNDVDFTADAVDCSGGGTGDGPSDSIYFSEYAEGSSNNKYMEIYNGSTETIDLSNYAYPNVSNDPTTPGIHEYWNTFAVGATIAPGDVYIIAHPDSAAEILAEADETFTYMSNGDDGFALVYGTETDYVVVDTLGDFNGDPGTGWEVAGVASATANHTLVRKATVTTGNANWDSSRGTNDTDSEWIVMAQDDWTNLGVR
jgi:predicted extracellular nuclease